MTVELRYWDAVTFLRFLQGAEGCEQCAAVLEEAEEEEPRTPALDHWRSAYQHCGAGPSPTATASAVFGDGVSPQPSSSGCQP